MIQEILKALSDCAISRYSITETKTDSIECFFIRRKLDMKRRTDLLEYSVTVYRPFEQDGTAMLGQATVGVHPGQSEDEIKKSLTQAYHSASFVCNPAYELYAGKTDHVRSESMFAEGPQQAMKKMAAAIFENDTAEDAFVNSAEVFVVSKRKHIVNSAGVDVSFHTENINGEYVIQCVVPQDVETHHQFSYRKVDAEALAADVKESLELTRERAKAVEAPQAGSYRLILSGQNLQEVLSFYDNRSAASMVYQKYSDYAPGMAVQGEDIEGDALTIELKAVEPYSPEGIPMVDRMLMENGTLKMLQAPKRFADYLGIEPTGYYGCKSVPTGSTPFAEMKSRPYLYVTTFSDFQMDAMSGHFAGEIRLGFLYDGEKVTPVTGGSVNGDITQAQKNFVFSKERFVTANYEGPYAVAMEDVAVAG
ncbi:MAG: metallopeptidase TldD-related protein [Lachnospiraceae bacterium]|nr:metallopeptidase TldD-related protein [Lachnospiraceae bacterium]